MKSFLLGYFLFLSLGTYANGPNESCNAQKIFIDGTYDKSTVPLLEQWSEASGSFTGLQVRGKENYQEVRLSFFFSDAAQVETKTYALKRNKLQELDFKNVLEELETKRKERPKKLIIAIYKGQSKLCEQEKLIIEQDSQDGVLKNP